MRTLRQRWDYLRTHWVDAVFWTAVVLAVGLVTGALRWLVTWGLTAAIVTLALVAFWMLLLLPSLIGWRIAAAFWGWKPK